VVEGVGVLGPHIQGLEPDDAIVYIRQEDGFTVGKGGEVVSFLLGRKGLVYGGIGPLCTDDAPNGGDGIGVVERGTADGDLHWRPPENRCRLTALILACFFWSSRRGHLFNEYGKMWGD
jgi:hypothetical protein